MPAYNLGAKGYPHEVQTGQGKAIREAAQVTVVSEIMARNIATPYRGKFNVLEETSKLTKYKYKEKPLKYLVFWDIPGSGSLEYSKVEDYFRENYLYVFDCLFLLLGEGNLTENDVMFARQAKDSRTPCAFIRSKSDILVKRSFEDPMTAEFDTMQETAQHIYDQVKENHRKSCPPDLQDVPYFLVSSDTILMIFNATIIPEEDSWRAGFDEVNLMEFIGSCARPCHQELNENVFSMLWSKVLSIFS
uniref:Uncharacterized protein n=1 Tax=Plectus sambesii TaxID=2011161 RepID=A0A914W2W4_9BILA